MANPPTQNDVNDKVREVLARWKKPQQLFIDGKFVAAKSGKTFTSINPANQEVLAEISQGGAADIDDAVKAARKAFQSKDWKLMRPSKRSEILFRIGDLIRKNALELAVMESLDNGKTISEGLNADLPSTWDIFHYYAGWPTKIHGETLPVAGPYLNYTLREPMGVCGQIVPWNYPLLMAAWKIAPALACGNTVVLKPAELTSLSVLRLVELCQEAGLPDGVLNIVCGPGSDAGAALTMHRDVNKVAFTGSTEVGRKIMEAAAKSNLKRVSLELGGKSPMIVFPDADPKAALKFIFGGIFYNKGEVCSASSRLFVEKSVYNTFVDGLKKMAEGIKLGNPQDLTTTMGPLVDKKQFNTVNDYISQGKSSGARLIAGGARPESGDLAKGNFVQPTVFADVPIDASISREEIFGPVLSVFPWESEEEVIQKANDTCYGLAASVWTKDLARAHRVAHALQAGTVWINSYNAFDSVSPFGGYKESGFGRELGMHALELYTQVKSIWVNLR